ncbi:MAG: ATPase [Spirochaetaceae bacterium]|nr:ATPase [Spirochaetaceae bacterium]
MIVPMKKVSLVLLEDHRKEALKKLRRLGVVHLEKVNGASQELTEFRDAYSKAELAYSILSEIKLPKKAAPAASFDRDKVLAMAQEVVALAERKKQCNDIITAHTLELERFAGWGDLDVESFQFLASKGIILSLYEIPRAAYLSMPETVETMVVNEAKSFVRALLIQHGEKGSTLAAACRPAEMPAEAYAVPMISSSSQALRDEIAALKEEIVSIDKALASAALDRNLLKQYCSVVGKDIEFENLFSGMGREDETEEGRPYMALAWLTGFVPAEDVAGVLVAAKEESWAVAVSDPTEEDEVPTKLKNNKLVSLIYPVSDFLGTVPGYTEYDISGWFLLFFCVFFGIIFGDGGYGALMVVAAVIADIMAVAKKKKIPPAYNLLLLLGFFTMAWGTVTCTWFGLSTDMLPGWLTSLSLQPISNAYASISPENEALVKQNLQIFCFMLALIQLSIAHIKGMIRYIKSPKCLGELGSLLQLWGIFFVVLNMVVKLDTFWGIPTMGSMVLGVVGVGFGLSFIFSNYEGSLGASILESCKNIVSVLLGVVNVFSDIVSYIRLWAVGLAGGAISATVNDMAGPMLGGALIFFGVLLLVFGHGLNMILNVLSVIVHGVRLNTLEFSSHLGMSWSGFAYEPFCETAENK